MAEQKINQKAQIPIRGLVSNGSSRLKTAYIELKDQDKAPAVGGFVMYDTTSKLKGRVVKKVGDNEISKAIGVVVSNSKSDSFLGVSGTNVVTISLFGSNTRIYLEAKSAFQKGDELEIDADKGLHKVKKKSTGTKIGVALEDAKNDKDIVLVLI